MPIISLPRHDWVVTLVGHVQLIGGRPGSLPRPAAGGCTAQASGRQTALIAERPANQRGVQQKRGRARRLFHPAKYLKRKEKKGKYSKWQYNRETHVWSPNFTMSMFGMTNMRSATIGVLKLQFSVERRCRIWLQIYVL